MIRKAAEDLLYIPTQRSDGFYQKELYLSFVKDYSDLRKRLSPFDYKEYEKLYSAKRHELKQAIKKLLLLIEKYPKCYEIHNLLTYCYIRIRRIKKADRSIINGYQLNPNHLLAKINYSDLLLRKKKLEEFETLFQNKFDLRDLYPDKEVFSAHEFVGFMTNLGFYYLVKKNYNFAEKYHYLASRIDQDGTNVRLLRKKLFHTPWYKKLYFKIRNIPSSN